MGNNGLVSDSVSGQPAAPAARRLRPTVRNMVWSLIPLIALIVIFIVIFQPGQQPVQTVNPKPDLDYATHQMGAPVPAPQGLSGKWRPTSSDMGTPNAAHQSNVEVGYLTPKNEYAKFVESNRPVAALVRNVVAGSSQRGTVAVDGRTWTRYRTSRGEIAIAVQRGRISAVVTGSAGLGELTTLAGSLR